MRKLFKKMNKRGNDLFPPIIIFIILNLIFFSSLMLFVKKNVESSQTYEEFYAKKIGLILDRAEPGMIFEINITDLIENAQKNGKKPNEIKENLIKINTEESYVEVRVSDKSGFRYPFFSKINLDEDITRINLDIQDGKIKGGVFSIGVK